jgi:ADP-heptose:LPS heptosyltransferase
LAAGAAALMKKRPIVCAGRFSFEETLALIRKMDLLITTHTSLMHAATMLGVPCAVLVGMSDCVRDGPYRPEPGTSAVVRGQSENDPALADEDEASTSMSAITAAEVVATAETLWRKG